MNERITTGALKQLIVKATGMEPAFVNVFIDDMISLIIETVSKGEEVRIEGLGTFRRVTVGAGRYTRIVFFADDQMKDGVNTPFAQFEPVVLKEGRPSEPKETAFVNMTEAEAEASADVVIKEDTEMTKNSDAETGVNRKPAEEAEAKKYQQEMAATEAPVEVSDGNGQLTQRVDEVIDNSIAEETGKTCTPSGCPASQNITSTRYGLWFVIVLLAISIIGTAIYFVVRVKESDKMPVQTEQQVSPESKVLPEKALPDNSASTPPVNDTVQALPAPTASSKEADIEPAVSQFPKHVVLKKGERLTLLSLRYYGNKFFWVYIFEANKKRYPDPEAIPAGARLLIPDPNDYGINSQSASSVEKAKQKAARILSY
ncbi:MAG: HU family DNA-binding protein [Bacteroidales bacterium]